MRHVHGGKRLGQGADLVDLDQQRIGAAAFDALGQTGGVGDEKIIAHQLNLAAQRLGQRLPSLPIILGTAILDGDDRIVAHQIGQVRHILSSAQAFTFTFKNIAAFLVILGRRAIQRQADILTRLVARLLHRFQNEIKRLTGRADIGCKAALIAHPGGQTGLIQLFLEHMEHFGAHAHRLGDAARADGHDHEFLNVDRVIGMLAAVDDVHHRHRQQPRRGAADIAVERLAAGIGGGLGDGQRDAQNGIGAQTGLVGCAVQLDQRAVDGHLLGRVRTHQRLGDLAVDGGHRVEHALAQIARLVAVAQFDRLMLAGGGARGHGGAPHRPVFEDHIHLDGRIAAAVKDFAAGDIENRGHDKALCWR